MQKRIPRSDWRRGKLFHYCRQGVVGVGVRAVADLVDGAGVVLREGEEGYIGAELEGGGAPLVLEGKLFLQGDVPEVYVGDGFGKIVNEEDVHEVFPEVGDVEAALVVVYLVGVDGLEEDAL